MAARNWIEFFIEKRSPAVKIPRSWYFFSINCQRSCKFGTAFWGKLNGERKKATHNFMQNVIHNYEKYDAPLTELSTQIASIKSVSFSGALTIRIGQDEWKFLLRTGKVGWASGGTKAVSIWEKNLRKYSPQFPQERITTISSLKMSQSAANALAQAVVDELIPRQQLTKLTSDITREIWLDLVNANHQNGNRLYYKISPDSAHTQLNFILPLVDFETI
jgi:hypothetical protein